MSSSKIIIGLYHYPHVNFFKNAITVLKNLGHKIEVVLRDRGDLIPIFEKEIPSVPFKVIGKHRKTTINKFRELLRNDLETINYLRNKDYDIVTGVSGINLSHAARLLGKPSIMFDDDPQDYTTFELYRLFTDRIILPKYTTAAGLKIKKYNGFKELAHLHPKYFEPNRDILKRYDLKAEKYVFVREQAPISIVYRHSFVGELYNYTKFLRNQGYKIILSLEDKKNAKIYGKVGQVLEEPVEDFHSIYR